jgi:hypothetical protein
VDICIGTRQIYDGNNMWHGHLFFFTKNILAGPDIKPRTVGESQAKAN